ncbi:hypothetical protein FQA39_LY02283 [Lamprigera yunnana]|nr:hypothetical protein FQA39_LY02283 [Lamprigera yunnana]
MNSTPSTSKVSPVKKRTRLNLGHLSVSEKQCILNMYKQILSDTYQMKITTIVKKIEDTAGVAKSHTMKEHRERRVLLPFVQVLEDDHML